MDECRRHYARWNILSVERRTLDYI
jgi:hypothetical protein